jgi:hypothetical protein
MVLPIHHLKRMEYFKFNRYIVAIQEAPVLILRVFGLRGLNPGIRSTGAPVPGSAGAIMSQTPVLRGTGERGPSTPGQSYSSRRSPTDIQVDCSLLV